MDLLARQFLRAVRGGRSQAAFARRLGFSSNPIANWEAGRHFPTAGEALRACARVDLDVMGGMGRLGGVRAPAPASLADEEIARWLRALRGTMTVAELAERTDATRTRTNRWLSGATRPRLPQFFRMVDTMTGRLGELLLQLVPLSALPALSEPERVNTALRELVRTEPWLQPVLFSMATRPWREAPEPLGNVWIAERLEVPVDVVERCISGLVAAGLLGWRDARWQLGPSFQLPLDPSDMPDAARFWGEVIGRREVRSHPNDRGHLIFAAVTSRAWRDMQEAIQRWKDEAWVLGRDPGPEEVLGLVYIRMVEWVGPDEDGR
jgi:transcriptional regulator with XRE-family HTH domain